MMFDTGFKLTERQKEGLKVLASAAIHILLYGGSRSGKTFLIVRCIVARAIKAPGSRHCILRFRFNHLKSAIIFDTFPAVMRKAFPTVEWKLSKADWYVTLENGSEIWFGGLDDKERTEKILGNEYVTIYLNECSQISWFSRNIVLTRLAMLVDCLVKGMDAHPMKPRMYYDCNPPNKAHWLYKLFIKKVDPETGEELKNPDDYACFKMDPKDNTENLSETYLDALKSLGSRLRKRFLDGEWADATPNALFPDEWIERWRETDLDRLPDMVRIVIGVDPSGADEDNPDHDAIGIIVAGLGTNGIGYVLADLTVNGGPVTWGKVVADAFDHYDADLVVGETNFGGAMVKHVIHSARPRTPFKSITVSRGKAIRAEPLSALVEDGRIRMAGQFKKLEDELSAFSTSGYSGDKSPNRGDAFTIALSELFPNIVKPPKKTFTAPRPTVNPMANLRRS